MALLTALPFFTFSQCIVINELLIDGASQFDGQSAPNTEEWIELYNTCDEPVDISCWALADGDFVIRFPQGTIIPPNDHFVIGSVNSNVPVDLFPATCNCASPLSATIIFTNGGEQLVLIDNAGVIQDAVIWGGGQSIPFTVNNSNGGCNSIVTSVTTITAQFETLPFVSGSAGQGCTYARTCDGNPNWEIRCGNEITGGSTNGEPVTVDFDAVSTLICVGECTEFTELCEGDISLYGWTFDGGQPAILYGETVTACYDTPGSYYVTLTVESACGVQFLAVEGFVTVYDNTIPEISGGEAGTYCEGENVTLSTTATGAIQWLMNNQIIPGANASSYNATVSGDYSVQVTNASCNNTSEIVSLAFLPNEQIVITASGPTTLCPTESVTLNTTFQGPYQWLNNGQPISGATSATLSVNQSGNYSLSSPNNGCIIASNAIEVIAFGDAPPVITSTSNSICPGESTQLQTVGIYDSYVWFLDNVEITGENSSTIQVNSSGVYSVIATLNNCTLASAPVTISDGEVPTVSLNTSANLPACPEISVPIEAIGNYSSITWQRDNIALTNTTAIINANAAGVYSATVLSEDGCAANSEGLSVTFLDVEVVQIVSSEGLSICANAFTDLSVDPIFSNYTWSQNGTALNENGSSLLQVGPGSYTLNVENNDGCNISASIQISSIPLPNVALQPNGNVITCDASFTFTVSGANTYSWYYNDEIFAANTNSIEVTMPGVYYVVGTTGNCTSQSLPSNLSFEESISVSIAASDTLVCEGENITLSVPNQFLNYLWSTGAQTPSTTVSSTSSVSIEVTDSNGCRGESTIDVVVAPNPIIELSSNFESDCVQGAEVTVASDGIISWQLSPYLTIIDSVTALYNPPFTTDFKISSINGECSSEEIFRINADCSTLFVPNTITPNGDGVNDVFLVSAQGVYTFELVIFDRWGNEVFRTEDQTEAWTGGINGYFVQDGAYTYMIKALDKFGIPITKDNLLFGTIHVLR